MVPLNIKMDLDLGSVHQASRDFGKLGEKAHGVGGDVQRANSDSAHDWGGDSGPAFRGTMTDVRGKADQVVEAANEAKSKTEQIVSFLTTAQNKKQQALSIGSQAGLRTTEEQIFEPGPAPKPPGQLPENATPQQQTDHAGAQQAQDAYHKQCQAYQQCTRLNNEADKARQQASQLAQAMVGSTPLKNVTTAASTVASLAGGAISRSNTLRNYAKAYRTMADSAGTSAQMADAVGDNEKYGQAMRERAGLLDKAETATQKAEGGFVTRNLNKLPPGGQRLLTGDYSETLGKNMGRFGKSVAKRIPVVGGLITAGTTAWDISQGKNPGKAVASGVGSTVAGTAGGAAASSAVTAAGTAMGVGEAAGAVAGPVGIVAGAAVGAGVGLLIDHWDDIF